MRIIFLIVGCFMYLLSDAQPCDSCFLLQENKTVELIRVSRKKRILFNKITLTVMGVDSTAGGRDSRFRYEYYDTEGKKLEDLYYRARCAGGSLFIELAFLIRTLHETTGEPVFLEYPDKMDVGDKFDDLVTAFYAKDINGDPLHFPVSVLKRQVVAKEIVSLGFGSVEAFKITYRLKTRQYVWGRFHKIDEVMTEWFVPGIGVVKIDDAFTIVELSVLNK